MSNVIKILALGVAVAASATMAKADTLAPGGTVTGSTTAVSGTTLASISGALTASTFTGEYEEFVIADTTNPYGSGDLTFVIAVEDNASSANHIEHVSIGDNGSAFALFPTVNVGSQAFGTAVPMSIDETVDGTVEFNFTGSDAIAPGATSYYLVIQTPATSYTSGLLGAIDSSTDTVPGFVPTTAPEPSSLALLGTGLLGAAGIARRRFFGR